MQVVIRGINTGRDAETNFALVVDGVLQTNPERAQPGAQRHHADRGAEGPAGRGLRPQRPRRRDHHDDAQAAATSRSSRSAPATAATTATRATCTSAARSATAAQGSLSLYTRSTDGQWNNTLLDCDDCVDYFEESGAIGRLTFDAGGGNFDVKAKYSTVESGAINFNAAVSFFEAATIFGAPPFDEDPNAHDFFYTNNIIPQNEQDNLNFSIKGDWDVGVGTLTGVLAYNDQTNFFLTDGASDAFFLYALTPSCNESFAARLADTPLPPPFNYGNPPGTIVSFTPYASSFQPPYGPTTCGGYQYQQRDQEDMSLEVRLTSPGDQRLRWLAGVYFADIERHVVVSQGSDNTGASLQQNFQARGFVPTGGPNPTDLLYDDTFDSKVYAGFGQIAYDIVDNVELALALRYDSEQREVDNNVPTGPVDSLAQTPLFAAIYGPTPFINPAYTVNPPFATDGIPSRSRTFDQFQPKLSVNWNLSDDVALYASYGYGFRSGGFNSSGSEATVDVFYGGLCLGPSTPFDTGLGFDVPLGLPACTADSVRNLTDVNDDYDKEVSKAAEIGFKSTLLDRTLAINGAIYHTEVEDMQFFNFFAGPFGLLRVVTNLDEVTIQGFELDFNWRANDYFSLFGGYRLHGRRDRPLRRTAVYGRQQAALRAGVHGQRRRRVHDADGRFRPRAGRARRWQLRRRDLVPPGAERDRAEPADRVRLRAGQLRQAEARSLRAVQRAADAARRALARDGLGTQPRRRGIPAGSDRGAGVRRRVHPRLAGPQLRLRRRLYVQVVNGGDARPFR